MNTKVLPINVVTNGNKLAIDINMKPVGRQLSKEKHYVHSQYFMVVDQHSAPRKMRVGIKISAFRGGIHLSDFIDSLQRIRGYDIFE